MYLDTILNRSSWIFDFDIRFKFSDLERPQKNFSYVSFFRKAIFKIQEVIFKLQRGRWSIKKYVSIFSTTTNVQRFIEISELYLDTSYVGGGQNLERPNVERPIFRKFKTSNIEITKVEIYKLLNFKNLLIFETQQFQKFDYFLLSLSIMEMWWFSKL